jgi:hypothetical protein
MKKFLSVPRSLMASSWHAQHQACPTSTSSSRHPPTRRSSACGRSTYLHLNGADLRDQPLAKRRSKPVSVVPRALQRQEAWKGIEQAAAR